MDIRFNTAQLDAYAVSETRYWVFYSLARSYDGIPAGVCWSTSDLYAFLESDVLVRYSKTVSGELVADETTVNDGRDIFVSMRGVEFNLADTYHACDVHNAMQTLMENLGRLHRSEDLKGSLSFKSIRTDVKVLKELLASVER